MDKDEIRPVPSRFTDNPFRDPNLPPEKQEWLDRRNAAIRHWHNTGDPEPAKEFGFSLPDRPERRAGGKADPVRENRAWLERRRAVLAHWHKTGDPKPARELGLNLRDMSQVKKLLVDETTSVEELIKAHHSDIPISFPDNTAGFFCPACGVWMDAS